MCILPNFTKRDLASEEDRKEKMKKAEAETLEIIVPDKPLLTNSK
jgi:hypothetical protein